MKLLPLNLLFFSSLAFAHPTPPTQPPDAFDPKPFQQAIVDAWGIPDLTAIQQGEHVYTEVTKSVDGSLPYLTMQDEKTVIRMFQRRDSRVFTLHNLARQIFPDGRYRDSVTETDYNIPRQRHDLPLVSVRPGFEIINELYEVCQPTARWNVTCSNLSTWTETVRAPDLVAKQPGCQYLPGCRLQKNVVSFDVEVSHRNELGRIVTDNYTYVAKMSADVPYFARLTDMCVSGFTDAVPRREKVPYTECQIVQNFMR